MRLPREGNAQRGEPEAACVSRKRGAGKGSIRELDASPCLWRSEHARGRSSRKGSILGMAFFLQHFRNFRRHVVLVVAG